MRKRIVNYKLEFYGPEMRGTSYTYVNVDKDNMKSNNWMHFKNFFDAIKEDVKKGYYYEVRISNNKLVLKGINEVNIFDKIDEEITYTWEDNYYLEPYINDELMEISNLQKKLQEENAESYRKMQEQEKQNLLYGQIINNGKKNIFTNKEDIKTYQDYLNKNKDYLIASAGGDAINLKTIKYGIIAMYTLIITGIISIFNFNYATLAIMMASAGTIIGITGNWLIKASRASKKETQRIEKEIQDLDIKYDNTQEEKISLKETNSFLEEVEWQLKNFENTIDNQDKLKAIKNLVLKYMDNQINGIINEEEYLNELQNILKQDDIREKKEDNLNLSLTK